MKASDVTTVADENPTIHAATGTIVPMPGVARSRSRRKHNEVVCLLLGADPSPVRAALKPGATQVVVEDLTGGDAVVRPGNTAATESRVVWEVFESRPAQPSGEWVTLHA